MKILMVNGLLLRLLGKYQSGDALALNITNIFVVNENNPNI